MPDSPLVPLHGAAAACANCDYREDLLEAGRCQPGDTCVRAHSGRQIDRFLRRNPELAADYVADAFWERRAIAARYAPLESVRPLAGDPDEVVRRTVAVRLPAEELNTMMHDPDREVRVTVASCLPATELDALLADPDYMVRAGGAPSSPWTVAPHGPRSGSGSTQGSGPPSTRIRTEENGS